MRKKLWFLPALLILTGVFLLTGCSDPNNPEPTPSVFVGTWVAYLPYPAPESINQVYSFQIETQFDFANDGTVSGRTGSKNLWKKTSDGFFAPADNDDIADYIAAYNAAISGNNAYKPWTQESWNAYMGEKKTFSGSYSDTGDDITIVIEGKSDRYRYEVSGRSIYLHSTSKDTHYALNKR